MPAVAPAVPARAWPDPAPLQDALTGMVANNQALGALLEVRDAVRGTFRGSAGLADPATGAAVDPGAHARIASDSKLFVAVAVLQLQAAGRLSLSDTVDRYLTPGLVPGGDQITIDMLLHHTSGLYDVFDSSLITAFIANQQRAWTADQLIARLAGHSPTGPPGGGYHYSNTNYLLAARIIEQITGAPYGQFVQAHILGPLHLTGTTVPAGTGIAAPYLRGFGNIRQSDGSLAPFDVTSQNATYWYGYGQLVSTAADMNTFYQALFGGALLAPDQLALLRTTVPMSPGDVANRYGAGVGRFDLSCGVTVWGHNGKIPGYQGSTYISDNGQRVYTLMYSNALSSSDVPYNAMLQRVFCDVPLASTGNPADGPAQLSVGRYSHAAVRGAGGQLLWAQQAWPSAAWTRTEEGGAILGNPVLASDSGSHLRAFAEGSDTHLVEIDLPHGGWVDSGITVSSAPAVLVGGPGRYDVFARAGSRLLHAGFDGTNWTVEIIAGTDGVASAPVAFTAGDGAMHVFYRRSDSRLAQAYRSGGAWLVDAIGSTEIASTPAAVSFGPGTAEVYARGTTGHLLRAGYGPTGWTWADLGGSISTAPALAAPVAGDVHVFAVGTDQRLWEFGPGGWVPHGDTTITAAGAGIGPRLDGPAAGYLAHVVAADTGGGLYELRGDTGAWGDWTRVIAL